MMTMAMQTAYNDLKSEWARERQGVAEEAARARREESRRQNVNGTYRNNQQSRKVRANDRQRSVTTQNFPLAKPPQVETIKFAGSFRTEEAASRHVRELEKREKEFMLKNATLVKMRSQTTLAGPTQFGNLRDDEATMRAKVEERTKAVFEELRAASDKEGSTRSLMGPPGLLRPSNDDKSKKRVGDGLKSTK
ncbi:MAG: hypothetical protein O3C57_02360 [Verrucomicrobia bacterium]|nr:hypothetical protein [Verrucomicrobiota bacterium]